MTTNHNQSLNDPSGSQWRKWDLHFHTPKSGKDYGNRGLTAANLIDRLISANVEVVAITDHHTMDAGFIRELIEASAGRVTILPGMELSSNLGGDEGVHFIAIFSENSDLDHLSSELSVKLDLQTKRKQGVAEERLYVEFPAAVKVIQELGGLITIHGHGKAANFETISSRLKFKQQQKTDLLRQYVDIVEVGNSKHAEFYQQNIFTQINFELPIVVCSDDHAKSPYPEEKYCWIKADRTLAGLQMALREPTTRFCLESVPPSTSRLEKNGTRYIKGISFTKLDSMPNGEEWLTGDIPLNPGLVAIVGNKGSGKSALSDCIGLLGSCGTASSFSFLSPGRFCEPKTGRAQHITASIKWHDGQESTRRLSEQIKLDESERLKYLPQSFVEDICNDLSTPGGGAFERELKKVVFSKVPRADKLGKKTLDELIVYRTEELHREADRLATRLVSEAQELGRLEERLDPTIKAALETRITQIREQIANHEGNKPKTIIPPTQDLVKTEQSTSDLEMLTNLKSERGVVLESIKKQEQVIIEQELLIAQSTKLLEKLNNIEVGFKRSLGDIASDARLLGIDVYSLATLSINRGPIKDIQDNAILKRGDAQKLLDGNPSEGLRTRAKDIETQQTSIQDRLDRPQREYQAYLDSLAVWQSTLETLQGCAEEPASLVGLQSEVGELASIPKKIQATISKLEDMAAEIHQLRLAEVEVYTQLYGPVQKFVTQHALAADQLRMEFKVELVQETFADGFLGFINKQRMGSFSGVEEGHERVHSLLAPINWGDWNEVKAFLSSIIEHLHQDKRPGYSQKLLVKNQITRGREVAELYSWLYGLSFLKPRYILKSEGKRLEQLSPGERGTLLLVFYLLVDDSDMPLVIDQPEANLDNATVAKKLVDCIRYARERRQVIIVTHNPNLAVVCDADQIIHASLDIEAGHRVTYSTGALENPMINQFTIDVLEGGRPPFNKRDTTYKITGQ